MPLFDWLKGDGVTPFFDWCRGEGYWHVHVGGYPNWFQIRWSNGKGDRYFGITREDNR